MKTNQNWKEMIEKSELMRKNAYCNAGYGSERKARVERMMIGRASALYAKALQIMAAEQK
jgi:hypothetical protein